MYAAMLLPASIPISLDPFASVSGPTLWILLIAVVAILTFRVYRSIKGSRFSKAMVYRLPIAYLAVTTISLFLLPQIYLYAAISALAVAAGYFIGRHLAGGVKFFDKDGQAYYKRSPFIMIIWLASFVFRFAIDMLFPANGPLTIIATVLLAGTTGLILGEAFRIVKMHSVYQKNKASAA